MLLSLAPEELALQLLSTLQTLLQNGVVHRDDTGRLAGDYPERQGEIELAITEARCANPVGVHAGRPSIRLDDIPTGWYASLMKPPAGPTTSGGARSKLLNAAISIIRKKGYAATSVDELCAWAGVTKGAFFHHFPSKDSLAVAAANHWSELSHARFAAAPYQQFADPLDRILGYLDFRKAILVGGVADFTCLAGTMLQEAYGTHPDIRDACDETIASHAAQLVSDIADAMTLYHLRAQWTAESLALHTQAVLQGAFILAKAKGSAAVVEASIDHLRCYIELLFRRPANETRTASSARTHRGPARSRQYRSRFSPIRKTAR